MPIFGPASPDTQVAPLLKAQEDYVKQQIPSVFASKAPKESPTKLFQSYLDTGNQVFKEASNNALNSLTAFAETSKEVATGLFNKSRIAEVPDMTAKGLGMLFADPIENQPDIVLPNGTVMPRIDPTGMVGGVQRLAKLGKEYEFIVDKPISVYRGEGKGISNSTFVHGKYFADSEDFAKNFGDVVEKSEIPAGSRIFDFDAIKSNPNQTVIPKEVLVDPDATTKWLLARGYDGTKNTNTRGVEYVLLPDINSAPEAVKLAAKSDSFESFTKSLLADWEKYRADIDAVSGTMNTAQKHHSNARELIWAQAQKMKDYVKGDTMRGFSKPAAILGGATAGSTAAIAASIFAKSDKEKQAGKENAEPIEHKPFEAGMPIVLPDRKVSISKSDIEAARPIIFAEVSNRSRDKQKLETQVILNTAINRMKQFRERGIDMTLQEVLEQDNQYQGYKSKQYELYKGNGNALDLEKKAAIDAIVDEIVLEMYEGRFKDNLDGDVFYTHSPDGSIYAHPGSLFK